MRHALALHEERAAMDPEYVWPHLRSLADPPKDRSFVQAWFVGTHMDLGGSRDQDGLSLYPLQWMLSESRKLGLAPAFLNTTKGSSIDNPLFLISPEVPLGEPGSKTHTFKNRNGIETQMHDLRSIHNDHDMHSRYAVRLNKNCSWLWPKKARVAFGPDGNLNGYDLSGEMWSSLCWFATVLTITSPTRHDFTPFCLLPTLLPHLLIDPSQHERERTAKESNHFRAENAGDARQTRHEPWRLGGQ